MRQLGAKLGLSGQSIHQWETGYTTPMARRLPEVAKALGCSIGDLYGEKST